LRLLPDVRPPPDHRVPQFGHQWQHSRTLPHTPRRRLVPAPPLPFQQPAASCHLLRVLYRVREATRCALWISRCVHLTWRCTCVDCARNREFRANDTGKHGPRQ